MRITATLLVLSLSMQLGCAGLGGVRPKTYNEWVGPQCAQFVEIISPPDELISTWGAQYPSSEMEFDECASAGKEALKKLKSTVGSVGSIAGKEYVIAKVVSVPTSCPEIATKEYKTKDCVDTAVAAMRDHMICGYKGPVAKEKSWITRGDVLRIESYCGTCTTATGSYMYPGSAGTTYSDLPCMKLAAVVIRPVGTKNWLPAQPGRGWIQPTDDGEE